MLGPAGVLARATSKGVVAAVALAEAIEQWIGLGPRSATSDVGAGRTPNRGFPIFCFFVVFSFFMFCSCSSIPVSFCFIYDLLITVSL